MSQNGAKREGAKRDAFIRNDDSSLKMHLSRFAPSSSSTRLGSRDLFYQPSLDVFVRADKSTPNGPALLNTEAIWIVLDPLDAFREEDRIETERIYVGDLESEQRSPRMDKQVSFLTHHVYPMCLRAAILQHLLHMPRSILGPSPEPLLKDEVEKSLEKRDRYLIGGPRLEEE